MYALDLELANSDSFRPTKTHIDILRMIKLWERVGVLTIYHNGEENIHSQITSTTPFT